MPKVICEKSGRVARVVLNTPEDRNAWDWPRMVEDGLTAQFTEHMDALADDEVGVVVISGNGPAFSTGANLTKVDFLYGMGDGTYGKGRPSQRIRLRRDHDLLNLYRYPLTYPKITVAQVHGFATGMSFALISCCDRRRGRQALARLPADGAGRQPDRHHQPDPDDRAEAGDGPAPDQRQAERHRSRRDRPRQHRRPRRRAAGGDRPLGRAGRLDAARRHRDRQVRPHPGLPLAGHAAGPRPPRARPTPCSPTCAGRRTSTTSSASGAKTGPKGRGANATTITRRRSRDPKAMREIGETLGGPGLHHLGFHVPDIEATRSKMAAAGFEPVFHGQGFGRGGGGAFAYFDTSAELGFWVEAIIPPAS